MQNYPYSNRSSKSIYNIPGHQSTESGPDVIYYNTTITNSNSTDPSSMYGGSVQPTPAQITTYNTDVVVQNPDDYYCSIIRFSVPGYTLPLAQFLIQTDNGIVTDINQGIYSFTMTYYDGIQTHSTGQIYWVYVPQSSSNKVAPPPVGTTGQQFTPYYFIYNYNQLIDIMNEALKDALNALKILVGGAISAATAPYFVYNPTTQLITLYAQDTYFDQGVFPASQTVYPNQVQDKIYLYFNSNASQYFDGFRYNASNREGNASGLDYYFIFENYNGSNLSSGVLAMSQEYVSLCYWNMIKNITIGTNMNVNSEITFINNPSGSQNQINVNVLTDFLPDFSNPGNEAGIFGKNFIYNAPSLYRIFEFKQKTPLQEISVDIYFTDEFQNTYRLYLEKGFQANIKFMFIKKSIFRSLSLDKINSLIH